MRCNGLFRAAIPAAALAAALSPAALTATVVARGDVVESNLRVFSSDGSTAFGSTADRLVPERPTPSSFLENREAAERSHLPYTVIGIGAQKCGTTMLWKVLRQHPDIVSDRKETRWFTNPGQSHCHYHPRVETSTDPVDESVLGHGCTSRVATSGVASMYDRYINKCFCGRAPRDNQTILDVSPGYSRKEHKRAIHNMKLMQADSVLRFFLVLRDPVARVISEINMQRKNGLTDAGDGQLVRRLGRDLDRHGASIVKGEYAEAVSRWLFHFGKESLLVINMAELDSLETWRRIFQHAGVRSLPDEVVTGMIATAKQEYAAKQRQKYAASTSSPFTAPDWLRGDLAAHYAPHNERLWELLGARWW